MKRPVGVTVSAVVGVIGSIIALLFSLLVVFTASTQAEPVPGVRGVGFVLAAIMAALGVLGLFTAVGLLNLRPWARTSILVFAALMAVFSLTAGATMAVLPLPPTPELPANMGTIRRVMVAIYAVPFLIGVWWLIQFNTKAAKEAFANAAPGEPPPRPLVISVIGWFNIVGGVFALGAGATGMPAFAAGFILTGWSAALYYVFFGGVNTYLGWRLLKLDERARILTIWWFGLTIAHTTFIALTPGARARLQELQEMMGPPDVPAPTFDTPMFTVAMMVASALLLAVAIWPLITMRSAFTHDVEAEHNGGH